MWCREVKVLKVAVLGVLTMALTGCAAVQPMTAPVGADPARYQADSARCAKEAAIARSGLLETTWEDPYQRCMRDSGYKTAG